MDLDSWIFGSLDSDSDLVTVWVDIKCGFKINRVTRVCVEYQMTCPHSDIFQVG